MSNLSVMSNILLIITCSDGEKFKAFINNDHTFYKTGLVQGLLELSDEYTTIDSDSHKVVRISMDICSSAISLYFNRVDINAQNISYDLLRLMMLTEDLHTEQIIKSMTPNIFNNEYGLAVSELVYNTFGNLLRTEMIRHNTYYDKNTNKFTKFDKNADLSMYEGSVYNPKNEPSIDFANRNLCINCISNNNIMIANPMQYDRCSYTMTSNNHLIEVLFILTSAVVIQSNVEIECIDTFEYDLQNAKFDVDLDNYARDVYKITRENNFSINKKRFKNFKSIEAKSHTYYKYVYELFAIADLNVFAMAIHFKQ